MSLPRSTALFWCTALNALALLPGLAAAGSTESFVAAMDGASVTPPNASTGSGWALLTHDAAAHTLLVEIEFGGLTGTSSGAHIHCCIAPPTNVAVAVILTGFPLAVSSGTYLQLFDLTTPAVYQAAFLVSSGGTPEAAEAALVSAMRTSFAYIDVHSSVWPGGEIRDALQPQLVFADGFEDQTTASWSSTQP